jgi:hypothetical protein
MSNVEGFYNSRGIQINSRSNGELIATCPFCDKEKHFYIKYSTGLYYCQRCSVSGNPWTFIDEHCGIREKKEIFEILKEYGLEPISCNNTKTNYIKSNYEEGMENITLMLRTQLVHARSYHSDKIEKALTLIKDNGIGFLTENFILPLFDPEGEVVGLQRFNKKGVLDHQGKRFTDKDGNKLKYASYSNKQGHKTGFFGLKLAIDNKLDIHTYVCCESPFNALSLQVNMGFDGTEGILAIGYPGTGHLPKRYRELFRDKIVYFLYDWDFKNLPGKDIGAGQNGVLNDVEKIKTVAQKMFNVSPDDELIKQFKQLKYKKVDLCEDFFNKGNYTKGDFNGLFQNAEEIAVEQKEDTKYVDGTTKSGYINTLRLRKELQSFEKKRKISEYILQSLKKVGRFINTSTSSYYWFDDRTMSLYSILEKDEVLGAFIETEFGLNTTEPEYKYLLSSLKTEAINNGMNTEVQRFAYYDDNNKSLYVSNNNQQIYKLDGGKIQLVTNGTDNVFFESEELYESFEYKENYMKCIDELIIDSINFEEGEGVTLDAEQQRKLFKIWFESLFFESILPTKPIQVMIGVKGSGKTSTQKGVGLLLFGKNFHTTTISKEADFIATISNSYYVAFDNVDALVPWLNDALARVATGQRISMRKLYTTNDKDDFIPKCFVSLNSRTPCYKRDDVASRLLVFRVGGFNNFKSQNEIEQRILEMRNDLWSELLNDLNEIVNHMRNNTEVKYSSFRIADFAVLGIHINAVLYGDRNEYLKLIDLMGKKQSQFLLEDNHLFECLSLWLDISRPRVRSSRTYTNINRWVSSSDLFKEFKLIVEKENSGLIFEFKSTTSLGVQLKNGLEDLRTEFDIKTNPSRARNLYSFNWKDQNSSEN